MFLDGFMVFVWYVFFLIDIFIVEFLMVMNGIRLKKYMFIDNLKYGMF